MDKPWHPNSLRGEENNNNKKGDKTEVKIEWRMGAVEEKPSCERQAGTSSMRVQETSETEELNNG